MKMNKKHGGWLMWLSVIAAVVSGYVSMSQTDVFGLAGTQWMMIAIILAIYGLYVKMNANA